MFAYKSSADFPATAATNLKSVWIALAMLLVVSDDMHRVGSGMYSSRLICSPAGANDPMYFLVVETVACVRIDPSDFASMILFAINLHLIKLPMNCTPSGKSVIISWSENLL